MKFEYLIFNIIVLVGPLIFSLIPFIFVHRPKVRDALPAIIIPAIVFLIFDYVVVDYFWSFNEKYILGPRFFHIPIEEILFFITVPYACLFLWVNWKNILKTDHFVRIRTFSIICFSILLFLSLHLQYTFIVILLFLLFLIIEVFFQTRLYTSRRFLLFLGVVCLLTGIFNGYLTARPVVEYNETVKTNINIFTIPIEDFLYGITLISLTVMIYEKRLQKK